MVNSRGNYRIKTNTVVYCLISFWIFIFVMSDSMLCAYPIMAEVLGKIVLGIRIVFVLLAFTIYFTGHINKYKLLYLFIFTAIVVLEYVFSDNWLIFDVFFISVFFGDKLNYRKVLKLFLLTTLVSLLVIFTLNILGALPEYAFYNTRVDHPRTTLGMHHPNALSRCLMVIVGSMFLLYNRTHFKGFVYVVMVSTAVWIAFFPNSLTIVVCIAAMLLLYAVLKKMITPLTTQKKKLLFRLIIFATVGMATFLYIVLLTSSFNNMSVFLKFPTVYSRIVYARRALAEYGITLFGTPFVTSNEISIFFHQDVNQYFVLDCLYYQLPIRYGIVGTGVFLYLYFKSIYLAIDSENLELLSILITMLIAGIIESHMTTCIMSFVFICSRCFMKSSKVEGYK